LEFDVNEVVHDVIRHNNYKDVLFKQELGQELLLRHEVQGFSGVPLPFLLGKAKIIQMNFYLDVFAIVLK
jgi:hypothetical protein